MRGILLPVLLLLSVTFSVISNVNFKSNGISTKYIHVMQNQSIKVQEGLGDILTINIGDKIIVNLIKSEAKHNIVKGSVFLDTHSAIVGTDYEYYQFNYRIKWINSAFLQDQQITVTMDSSGGNNIVTESLTYNKDFVLNTFNIKCEDKYVYQSNGEYWYKGGIDSKKNSLRCEGNLSYKYDENIYPLKEIGVYINFNGVKTAIADVNTAGSFVFDNFSLPYVSSSSGVSKNVLVEINLLNPQGSSSLFISSAKVNTMSINIDNGAPELNASEFLLLPDLVDDEIAVTPEIGWYNQTTISIKMINKATDNGGSGLRTSFLYKSIVQQKIGSADVTINIETLEGLRRKIHVYALDNVYNRTTMSIVVNVDIHAPEIFSISLDEDKEQNIGQTNPDTGWYNDETVSFRWDKPLDMSLRDKPYQIKADYGTSIWSAQVGNFMITNSYQDVTVCSTLNVSEGGGIPRTIYVRAVDKAGNIRIVQKKVYVDLTPPAKNYLTLVPDTTAADGHRRPDNGWYNDGSEVKWLWAFSDNSNELTSLRYRYRNSVGEKNVATSDWTNVTTVILDTSETPTGNTFYLQARDKAGNMILVTETVYVDETKPSFNMININFLEDTSDNGNDGIFPLSGWYDQTTFDVLVTWNIDKEEGSLSKILLKAVDYQFEYQENDILITTFSNIAINPREDNTLVRFQLLLADKAGWVKGIFQDINVDLKPPVNLHFMLKQDKDSNGDGIDPLTGWYDDNTVYINWQSPQDAGSLRKNPYRIKVNDNAWSSWQSQLFKDNLVVTDNNNNLITLLCADKAGNVVTAEVRVTVDTKIPTGYFEIVLSEDVDSGGDGVDPYNSEWYDSNTINVNVVLDKVNDNLGLRNNKYFIKDDVYKPNYGSGSVSSHNLLIKTTEGGGQARQIIVGIADKAGNIYAKTSRVYVDLTNPTILNAWVKNDNTDTDGNGYFPEKGWYDDPGIDIAWDAAYDSGGLPEFPYRYKARLSPTWSAWQNNRDANDILVNTDSSMTKDIYIQARDMAGNLVTKSLQINVDMLPPAITCSVLQQETITMFRGVNLPLTGWFTTNRVTLNWALINENGQLRDKPYRYKYSMLQTQYTPFISKNITEARLSVNYSIEPIVFSLFALDRAGNSTEITTAIRVDTEAPIATVSYTVNRSFIKPYLITSDVVLITVSVSEEVIITPMLYYYDIKTPGTKYNVDLNPNGGKFWQGEFSLAARKDGNYKYGLNLFDNAANLTTTVNGETYFIIQTATPVPARNFRIWSLLSKDENYTNFGQVGVTFDVDSSITQFLINENPSINMLNITSFSSYPTNNNIYTFSDQAESGRRPLYLWVANDKNIIAASAVVNEIYFDKEDPVVKIRPDESLTDIVNIYNNVTVPMGPMSAVLEIFNAAYDPDYREQASVVPFWQVFLPGNPGLITINLSPRLIVTETTNTLNYKQQWMAEYNTSLAVDSGVGYFRVRVTDNALNTTTIIKAGATFNINLDAASTPKIQVYALDGRKNYTNSLNVNVVIIKNYANAIYDTYKITDGSSSRPIAAEVNNDWPSDDVKITVSYRIAAGIDYKDVSEEPHSIYAWTRKGIYVNPGMAKDIITFDRTIPTYDFKVANYQKESYLPEEIRVTFFINEILDPDRQHIIKFISAGQSKDSALKYFSKQGKEYVYITTINVLGGNKEKLDNKIRIIARDRAGNVLDSTRHLKNGLYIKSYIDEIAGQNPYIAQGEKNYVVMSCIVIANDFPVKLKGIRIMAEQGQYIASDIQSIRIYTDSNNSGKLETDYSQDTLKGIGKSNLAVTSSVYIQFSENELIASSNAKKFFVVIDLNKSAIEGNKVYFKFAKNAFVTDEDNLVVYNNQLNTFQTKMLSFVKAITRITAVKVNNDLIVTTLNQGVKDALLMSIRFDADLGSVVWKGLRLRYYGSMNPAYIKNLSVFSDVDHNGFFNPKKDSLISSGKDRFQNGRLTTDINLVDNKILNVNSDKDTYYVVAELKVDTELLSTFSVVIITSDCVFISTPDIVINTTFPLYSREFNITRYISKVNIFYHRNPQEDIYQGDGVMLQKFKMDVDYYKPYWNSVIYKIEGTANKDDFADVDIYILTDNITYDNNLFYLLDESTKVAASNQWFQDNKKIKITFTNPLRLLSSNTFALLVTINQAAGDDKIFSFVSYFSSSDNVDYDFTLGTANKEVLVTSTRMTVINKYQPRKPDINASTYISDIRKLKYKFSTGTKQGNNVIEYKYSIGLNSGADNFLRYQTSLVLPPSWLLNNYPVETNLSNNNLSFNDNTKYYLNLKAVGLGQGGAKHYSKEAHFAFKTDFSPPFLPNSSLEIVVNDHDMNSISHHLIWADFIEAESKLDSYIVEQKANYSPAWNFIKQISIKNPDNITPAEHSINLINRVPDMSYSYRVKAVNKAGLSSEYLYTKAVTSTQTKKVLSNVSNYPNPFYSRREETKIFYYLNQNTGVVVAIYDSMGHFVKKFNYSQGIAGKSMKGDCEIAWNGTNEAGEFVSKGGYFVVIEAPEAEGGDNKIIHMIGVIH